MLAKLRDSDPRLIGPYVLRGRLGSGGMGVVYLAEGSLGEKVAIKVIQPERLLDARIRTRFRREAAAAGAVPEFCTAAVLDVDLEAEQPYLVSEYISGPSLAERVEDDGPLRAGELESLAIAMAAALSKIHQCGVIHRDLKPANVMLGPLGPRVIDFGLATLTELNDDASRSRDRIGTPAFMSPEQFAGGAVDYPTDVFAWASVVYFAATGGPPFGSELSQLNYRLRFEHPDLSEIPPTLLVAIKGAFSKDPSVRPRSSDLLKAIIDLDPDVVIAGTSSITFRKRERLVTARDWVTVGLDRYGEGKWQFALMAALKAIEIDPLFARARFLQGIAQQKLGDITGGLAALQLAWEIDSTDIEITANYARSICQYRSAEIEYAFTLAPEDEMVRHSYAQLISSDKQRLAEAFELDPKNESIRDARIAQLLSLGDSGIAEATLLAVKGQFAAELMCLLEVEEQVVAAFDAAPENAEVRAGAKRLLLKKGTEGQIVAQELGLLGRVESEDLIRRVVNESNEHAVRRVAACFPDRLDLRAQVLQIISLKGVAGVSDGIKFATEGPSASQMLELFLRYLSSHSDSLNALRQAFELRPSDVSVRRALELSLRSQGAQGLREAFQKLLINVEQFTDFLLDGGVAEHEQALQLLPNSQQVQRALLSKLCEHIPVDSGRIARILSNVSDEVQQEFLTIPRVAQDLALLSALRSSLPANAEVGQALANRLSKQGLAQRRAAHRLVPEDRRIMQRLVSGLLETRRLPEVREALFLTDFELSTVRVYADVLAALKMPRLCKYLESSEDSSRLDLSRISDILGESDLLAEVAEAHCIDPSSEVVRRKYSLVLLRCGQIESAARLSPNSEDVRSAVVKNVLELNPEALHAFFSALPGDSKDRLSCIGALLKGLSQPGKRLAAFAILYPLLSLHERAVADSLLLGFLKSVVFSDMLYLGASSLEKKIELLRTGARLTRSRRVEGSLIALAEAATLRRRDKLIGPLFGISICLAIIIATSTIVNWLSAGSVLTGGAVLGGITIALWAWLLDANSIRRRRLRRLRVMIEEPGRRSRT